MKKNEGIIDSKMKGKKRYLGWIIMTTLFIAAMFFAGSCSGGLENTSGTGGIKFILDYFDGKTNPDGSPCTVAFFLQANAGDDTAASQENTPTSDSYLLVQRAWKDIEAAGHEIGCHTYSHMHSYNVDWDKGGEYSLLLTADEIKADIKHAMEVYKKAGLDTSKIVGFRAPFLEVDNTMLSVASDLGFQYDCSIEDGWEAYQFKTQGDTDALTGRTMWWPYTFDNDLPATNWTGVVSPSPAGAYTWANNPGRVASTKHAGFWEFSEIGLQVPGDDLAATYGFDPGLRKRIFLMCSWLCIPDRDYQIGSWSAFRYFQDLNHDGVRDIMTTAGDPAVDLPVNSWDSEYTGAGQYFVTTTADATAETVDNYLFKNTNAERNPKMNDSMDWNLWFASALNADEFVAILKYTLDERMAGNKAPFIFGCHSDIYASKNENLGPDDIAPNATLKERQDALVEFLDYARSKGCTIASTSKVMEWIKENNGHPAYQDASVLIPGGKAAADVPQFVSLSIDDNKFSGYDDQFY